MLLSHISNRSYLILMLLIGSMAYTIGASVADAQKSAPVDETLSYQVTIELPAPFIKQLNDAGLNLLDHLQLLGCENARFEQLPNGRVVTHCDKPPRALKINGFQAIHYFQLETEPNPNRITFSPTELVTDIRISTNQTYYFDNADQQTRQFVDNQTLSLPYQQIGQELQFRVRPASKTPGDDLTKRLTLAEVMQERRYLTLKPTAVSKTDHKYHADDAVYQFSNQAACRDGRDSTRLSRYAELQSVQFTPGTFVKLFDELTGKPTSRCTQLTTQQSVPDFQPYDCFGKRRLIVISTGEKLNRYGRQIPQTLLTVFQNQLHSRVPFTLVTIQPGRRLSPPRLRCEDLADLDQSEAQRFIWQRLNNIRFGASDLRALQDLDLVNVVYPKQQLQRVLYLTDNSGIPTDINQINDKDLSVPLISWKRAAVPLTVLTTGSCTPWTNKAEAKCEVLDNQPAMTQIQQALEAFLTE